MQLIIIRYMDIEIAFPYKNLEFDLLTNQYKKQYQMLQVNIRAVP